MTLNIDGVDETNQLSEEELDLVYEVLECAARMEKVEEDAEVSLVFVDNLKIQEINSEYRGKDQPTDVISFALEEEGEGEVHVEGSDMPRVLGDIIISIDKAREQAEEYSHSFNRELGFLAVHGFLPLLGYDHETKEDEQVMFGKQEAILSEYGLER